MRTFSRNFLMIVLTIIACTSANAQWVDPAPTGGDIHYNNGNVGIGAASTGSLLHVSGPYSGTSQMTINSTSSNTELRFSYGGVAKGYAWYTGSSDRMAFGRGSTSNSMFIDGTGKFGFGISSPTGSWGEKLHVYDATANVGIKIQRGDGASASLLANQSEVLLGSGSNHNLGLMTNGGTRVLIDQSGNVGIGTVTPTAQLEIGGQYSSSAPHLIVNATTTNGEIQFRDNGTLKGAAWYWKNSDLIAFGRGSVANSMFVSSAGYFGIGTTTPDAELSVNGTVHAKKLKASVSGWPDYVFGKEYNLRSLESTADYIEKHHHLPEVPSAQEMEENGLDVAEMNKLLLKKIEELTLHMIQLKEKSDQQDKVIQDLMQKLDQ